MFNVSPIFRLAIGLILLTVSLLLVGDMLGITPDERRAELDARKSIAEALAVQVSTDISENRVAAVANTVEALQKRNDNVLSVGLRQSDGRLVAVAGDHTVHWDPTVEDRSTSSHVKVPIYGESGPWGVVEVAFVPLDSIWASVFRGGSIASVILFVALAGFAAYWLFLKRALNELDPSSVVPDRVRAALDALAEGLVILDQSGRIVLANRAFERKLGTQRDLLVGSSLAALDWKKQEGGDAAKRMPWQFLIDVGEAPPASQMELRTAANERLSFAVNCSPVKGPNGAIRGVVVTFDDLTELEQKNGELERTLGKLEQSQREITRQNRELQVLATRDPLTGVLNRRSLFEGMKTLLAEAADSDEPLSVIMVDIDHFKSINDRFGHATGDKVIKMLSGILTQAVRAEDLVGRYGGEEFCVALPGHDEAQAAEIAEHMRLVLNDGKNARYTSALRISASFGVSTDWHGKMTSGALVDLADKALYEAKESGRNRVVCWSQVASEEAATAHGVSADTATPSATETPASDVEVETEADGPTVSETVRLRARVAELEALTNQQMAEGIAVDENTGLPNRLVLLDRIRQSMQRSQREGSRMVLLSLDIDAIKVVRNTQGSGSADKLMRMVGARLKTTVRSVDTVAVQDGAELEVSVSTMGHGEFAVLLSDLSDIDSTTWIVQRIFSSLDETAEIDGSEILLDASIGVSVFPNDGDEPDVLLTNSAAALREAIATDGRNVCLFYSKTMNQQSQEQLRMRTQLRHAIDRDELFLEYQPGIDMHDERITSFEALLRWRHPEWGLVRPDRFIPIAEHASLIDQLGAWVFETAMRQLKAWQDAGSDKLSMSVNFSAVQFRNIDLVDRVVSTLGEIGVDPSSVIVEITESTLIQNLETAVAIVEGLSKAGLRIALDDFGTGYSSLSYLNRFPIDIVKIDRSFLQDFPSKANDTEIVSAIIAIAHSLGMRVVAEGVETDRQLKVLQNLQCDEIQGYLFSKPISREHAAELLVNPTNIRRIARNAGQIGIGAVGGRNSAIIGVVNQAPRRGFGT